jgi:hypothetical protein
VTYARRHLRFGWWSLLVFATLGFALETLHGFKVDWYLSVSNETRRLMWTLAHAHGTLLSIVHILLAVSLHAIPELRERNLRLVSTSLIAASILLPGGFFLGGLVFYGGDPGPVATVLIPVGAMCLLIATFLIARSSADVGQTGSPGRTPPSRSKRDAQR